MIGIHLILGGQYILSNRTGFPSSHFSHKHSVMPPYMLSRFGVQL